MATWKIAVIAAGGAVLVAAVVIIALVAKSKMSAANVQVESINNEEVSGKIVVENLGTKADYLSP